MDEGKISLDSITVGLFLEKHLKLKDKFIQYGGYEVISESNKYVNAENFDSYVKELMKWNSLIALVHKGYPILDRLSDYVNMSIDDIYKEFEGQLNDVFAKVNSEYSSHDISDNIYKLIEDLDKGMAIGLPYNNMEILSQETGGQALGTVTLIGGLSNVGKSTFFRNAILPVIIDKKEKIVIMLNEENLAKWQREFLVFIANNILNEKLQKKMVRNGSFSVDKKELLFKAADWLKENTKNHTITIVNFKQYKTERALRVIRKYSAMGVKYFGLDTFKLDSGKRGNIPSHEIMAQKVVDIYDLVKEENKNVHIAITFQLAKDSTRQRFYMIDNIGVSKNIVDPSSTCIMIRKMFEDEYPGGNKYLEVKDKEGKILFLDKNKNYQILFIVKNREGRANEYQIVIEHDLSRNMIKEVGTCHVPLDF